MTFISKLKEYLCVCLLTGWEETRKASEGHPFAGGL